MFGCQREQRPQLRHGDKDCFSAVAYRTVSFPVGRQHSTHPHVSPPPLVNVGTHCVHVCCKTLAWQLSTQRLAPSLSEGQLFIMSRSRKKCYSQLGSCLTRRAVDLRFSRLYFRRLWLRGNAHPYAFLCVFSLFFSTNILCLLSSGVFMPCKYFLSSSPSCFLSSLSLSF